LEAKKRLLEAKKSILEALNNLEAEKKYFGGTQKFGGKKK